MGEGCVIVKYRMKAKITEIFKSIQGEGIYQGVKQVFVRFFGCNLSCSFCDTKQSFYEEKTLGEVIEGILTHKDYHSISLTGGEPLLQIDFLKELAKFLKKESRIIYLETNGILCGHLEEILDYTDIIAMDFKLPSSTKMRSFWKEHKEFLKVALRKEVFAKAVIGKATLTEDIRKAIEVIKTVKKDLFFILQPQNPFEDLLEAKLINFEKICREQNINARVIAQLHKELGVR